MDPLLLVRHHVADLHRDADLHRLARQVPPRPRAATPSWAPARALGRRVVESVRATHRSASGAGAADVCCA